PAGAASGNVVVPGAALLAYGSARGAGCAAGCAGAGVCGGVWVWAANAAIPRDAQRTVAISGCLIVFLPVASSSAGWRILPQRTPRTQRLKTCLFRRVRRGTSGGVG